MDNIAIVLKEKTLLGYIINVYLIYKGWRKVILFNLLPYIILESGWLVILLLESGVIEFFCHFIFHNGIE